MSYTRPQTSAAGTAQLPKLPKGNYRVAVLEQDLSPSKTSGAQMITCKVQVLAPETVTMPDGRVAKTAGVKDTLRFTFTESSLPAVIDACTKLEVVLPPAAATFDEDVRLMQEALSKRLQQLTFEICAESKREPQKGPGGEVLMDGLGRPILGFERVDFNMFNLVGLPKTFTELGITVQSAPF